MRFIITQFAEHVGNKTAIQIRSHAQKFFSKVVRESSVVDGTEVAEPIEIPPPRAKRKPTRPYPRKVLIPSTKEARPVRSNSPYPSRSNHEIPSPSSTESSSTQSLKLFGKTVYFTDSIKPSCTDTLTTLPWNSMSTRSTDCPTTTLSLNYHCLQSSDRKEPKDQCYSDDGRNGVFGSKGEKYAKGFVPYKRCLAEKSANLHSFMLTGEERDDLRVRLCL